MVLVVLSPPTAMMDMPTLDYCSKQIRASKPASYEETEFLTSEERRAYDWVNFNQKLLEQEKIPHAYSVERLRGIVNSVAP
jgi:hypothetical protein